jgi:structural maintenance of chromosome 2
LALDLIEYEPEFAPVMKYVFGSFFVVDDNETAKKLIDNPIRKCKCVTLKGDKYDPSGTLEGGY